MARRFGSAMISNTDSTRLIYRYIHILVKEYMTEANLANGYRTNLPGHTPWKYFGGCRADEPRRCQI